MKNFEQIPPKSTKIERMNGNDGTIGVIGSIADIPTTMHSLLGDILLYAKNNLTKKAATEGDCAFVAGEICKKFEKKFERYGCALDLARTSSPQGIPIYKKLGYGYHILNVVIGEHVCFAIDCTASYTLPDQKIDLLLVTAVDEDELLVRLKDFSGSRSTMSND